MFVLAPASLLIVASVLLEASEVEVNTSLLVSAALSNLVVSMMTVVASVMVDIASPDDNLERVDDLELSVVSDCGRQWYRSCILTFVFLSLFFFFFFFFFCNTSS